MRPAARWGWLAALLALTAAPYLYGLAHGPHGAAFTWVLPPYADDGLAYHAWVRQAALGEWLFRVKYSAAPQPAVLFQPFFLLAGLLCRLTGAGPGVALFLLREAGVALFLLALERFLRRFPLEPRVRALALAFAALSSGFGFLAKLGLPALPADLWLVDLNTLWSLTWNPLYPLALALMLWSLDLALDGRAWAAGALVSVLALLHPYDAAIVAAAVAASTFIRRRGFRGLLMFAAAAAPGVAYQLWASSYNPVLAGHAEAGTMASPSPLGLLFGLGLPGILAVLGSVSVIRRRKAAEFAPALGWAAAVLIAAYLPVWFQRKFLFGLQVPVAVLAAVAADALLIKASGPRRNLKYAFLAALLVAATLPTHFVNARRTAASLSAAGDRGPYYVGPELKSAFDALKSVSRPGDVVLAAPDLSLLIPGVTGNTVLAGHWAQSAASAPALERALSAFGAAPALGSAARAELLRGEGIRFVLLDETAGETPRWLRASAAEEFRSPRFALYRLADATGAASSRR